MQSVLIVLLLAGSAVAETEPIKKGTVARNAFTLKRGAATEDKPKNLKVEVNRTYVEQEIEVWYINQAKREDRRDCIEKQLTEMGIVPHRFEAIEPKPEDLKEGGKYHDCVKGGFLRNNAYVDAGNGAVRSGEHVKMGIIGDTCSHKRIFEQLAQRNSSAKYFVVLEDDVILNPLKFKTAINSFVDPEWGYKGPFADNWQMVQLDFIGSYCQNHKIGKAAGKRVFKPKDVYMPGYGGADCARYFGTQAMLMQKDTLPSVVQHMETHKALPMDHLQGELPRALAWRPQIAHGSSSRQGLKLPEFCSKKSRASSINLAFRRESNKKADRENNIDRNQWMDEFKAATPEEKETDDVATDEE
jgi:hypothetical protein